MIYYVYIYYFNNIPVYIGLGHGKRAWNHLRPSVRKSRQSKYFYNKLEKEGIENFNIVILRSGLSLAEAILIEETLIYWLGRKDNKTGILYNLTNGGEGHSGYIKSKELRNRISIWSRNKTISEEQKEIIRFCNTNKHPSQETRNKMSLSQTGMLKPKKPESIPNYIRAAQLRCSDPIYIQGIKDRLNIKWSRSVVQLDNFNNIIRIWDNHHDAAKFLNCRPDRIIQVCLGNSYKCKKFKWKFYDNK
jgi:group I intron endonuclease